MCATTLCVRCARIRGQGGRKPRRRGKVPAELSPIAAASALSAMLERMAAFHADLEVYGASRADVVETTARIVYQTCTGCIA
jgi:hypothetical protein